MKLKLSPEQSANLNDIIRIFRQESAVRDNLQEEMLRIILKRFIITCTRIAREKCGVTPEQEKAFDIVRRFYILVDQHFREKKQVQEMTRIILNLDKIPKPDDAADALAMAVCHCHCSGSVMGRLNTSI